MNPAPMVALVGNPNAGKSALFNALTGARQKVGNYPGVTVERKAGRMSLPDGRPIELIDLPGTYSLEPASPDEQVTRDVLFGKQEGERLPQAILVVVDATNLDNHLRFALQLIRTRAAGGGRAQHDRHGRARWPHDRCGRSSRPNSACPVIPTVAVRKRGIDELKRAMESLIGDGSVRKIASEADVVHEDIVVLQRRARAIAIAATREEQGARRWSHRIDARRAPPGRRTAADGGDPVRDVPGGVRLGAAADGRDHRAVRYDRPLGADRAAGRASCATC